jgi:hypothetical protein
MLPAGPAKKFALATQDRQVVDLLVAMRDYLAHKSTSSRKVLNLRITSLMGVNLSLVASFRGIGVYLKTPLGGISRIKLIIAESDRSLRHCDMHNRVQASGREIKSNSFAQPQLKSVRGQG